MKKTLILLIFLPILAFGQLMVSGGGSSLDLTTLLPIIADSTLWHLQGADTLVTDGALPVKVSGLRVSGTTRLDGTLTLITTAAESLLIGAGGFRNEGGLRQKGLSQFGATATPVYITADGKVGIGTSTSSPYNAWGIVSPTSGRGTGLGLTSSQWNKKRTDWVTASDTSAIGMYIDSAGGPRLSMKAVDGDTLGVFMDGAYMQIITNANLVLSGGSTNILKSGSTTVGIWTSTYFGLYTDDALSFGQPYRRAQNIYSSDIFYHGGKGQTATQYISKENTIAGSDSSMMFRIGSDGNPYMRWAAADADSARMHVRSDSTEFYSKNALVLDAPAVLIGASNVGISKMDTVFTAGYVPRWVKFTSGAKSWYSPVYADTTGKW